MSGNTPSLEPILSKRLVFVTGKGGVGKTRVTAMLAMEAAKANKRVCIVESSCYDQVGRHFGTPQTGHELVQLAPNIHGINLDPQENFRDFVVSHLKAPQLFDRVFSQPAVKSFIKLIPGISELTLLGRLYYYCEEVDEPKFDLVLFDSYASGHFLGLVKSLEAIIESGIGGPLSDETRMVKDYVTDPRLSGTVLVSLPEDVVMEETWEFHARIEREARIPFLAVVLNRLWTQVPPEPEGSLPACHSWVDRKIRLSKHHRDEVISQLGQSGLNLGMLDEDSLARPSLEPPFFDLHDWGICDAP